MPQLAVFTANHWISTYLFCSYCVYLWLRGGQCVSPLCAWSFAGSRAVSKQTAAHGFNHICGLSTRVFVQPRIIGLPFDTLGIQNLIIDSLIINEQLLEVRCFCSSFLPPPSNPPRLSILLSALLPPSSPPPPVLSRASRSVCFSTSMAASTPALLY